MSVSVIRQDGDGEWTFDACPTEDYSTSIEVTEHPIEDGAKVADHAQPQPVEISLEGYVSGSPFDYQFKADEDNRPRKAVEFFDELDGVLVTVVSQRLGSYENCLLTEYPHRVTVQDGIVIRAGFKQEEIAKSEKVELPPEQPKPEHSSSVSDEQDVGRQPKGEDDNNVTDHVVERNGVFFY